MLAAALANLFSNCRIIFVLFCLRLSLIQTVWEEQPGFQLRDDIVKRLSAKVDQVLYYSP